MDRLRRPPGRSYVARRHAQICGGFARGDSGECAALGSCGSRGVVPAVAVLLRVSVLGAAYARVTKPCERLRWGAAVLCTDDTSLRSCLRQLHVWAAGLVSRSVAIGTITVCAVADITVAIASCAAVWRLQRPRRVCFLHVGSRPRPRLALGVGPGEAADTAATPASCVATSLVLASCVVRVLSLYILAPLRVGGSSKCKL